MKVVRVDWNRDGFRHTDDMVLLATDPKYWEDVVAVLISEINDTRGGAGWGNGTWTQHTYAILPPSMKHDLVPEKYRADRQKQVLFNLKMLDSILAMMPDQTQSSPELADVEEKLDELRLYFGKELYPNKYKAVVSPDLLFDIHSEVDATTTPTWQSPLRTKPKKGKIDWVLDVLGY